MTGTGTLADPFILSTEDDLLLIKNNLTAYYQLKNDIELNSYQNAPGWLPIVGNFTGNIDGKGFAIKKLYIGRPSDNNIGFFASFCGTMKNIKFLEARVIGNQYVGVVSGLYGATSGTALYDNVIVEGNIVATTGYAGGILGSNASQVLQMTNCSFKGTIVCNANSNYMGGLVAYAANNTVNAFIRNCTFEGNLGWADQHYYMSNIGGIVGAFNQEISKCTVKGNIYGLSTIGGIVGTCPTGNNIGSLIIENTVNGYIGLVSGSGYVGGIVGNITNSKVERNFVVLTIQSLFPATMVGGIVGQLSGSSTYGIRNNETQGRINITGGGNYIGGICGYENSSGAYYEGNINSMNLECPSATYVGGIVGQPYAGVVQFCVNFGTITAQSYLGGIVGRNRSSGYLTVQYCLNYGVVATTAGNNSYQGGVVGSGFYTYINYCANFQNLGQEKVHSIFQNESNGSQSYCFYINYDGAANWYTTEGTALTLDNAKKIKSYSQWDFNTKFVILENDRLPMPVNCGRYTNYNFTFTYPNSVLDNLVAGDKFRLLYNCDWASSAAINAKFQIYDGSSWRYIEGKLEASGADLVVPIDIKETYGGLVRIVFFTASSYFSVSTNAFHIVESTQRGIIFVDENYSPYNNADGTVIRNIKFQNLFLNSLSQAKHLFVYNATTVNIMKTTIAVTNSSPAVTVSLGSKNDASYEAVASLIITDLKPGEFRDLYIKVQTSNDSSAALVPISLYAEQTVVA